jgi:hypothetical protein
MYAPLLALLGVDARVRSLECVPVQDVPDL